MLDWLWLKKKLVIENAGRENLPKYKTDKYMEIIREKLREVRSIQIYEIFSNKALSIFLLSSFSRYDIHPQFALQFKVVVGAPTLLSIFQTVI